MEPRFRIIQASIEMESIVSSFLAEILKIEDFKNSKVLGNNSSSISFNQKINLLIEIGALNAENRNKFESFMEIRNQFAHNLDAKTYETCIDICNKKNGIEKKLNKWYPKEEEINKEKKLSYQIGKLIEDIVKAIVAVVEFLVNTIENEKQNEKYPLRVISYMLTLEQIPTFLNQIIDSNNKLKKNISRKNKEIIINELKRMTKEEYDSLINESLHDQKIKYTTKSRIDAANAIIERNSVKENNLPK